MEKLMDDSRSDLGYPGLIKSGGTAEGEALMSPGEFVQIHKSMPSPCDITRESSGSQLSSSS
jgi:hypothetical protein